MDFKKLIEDANIEMNDTLDYLADCLQNYNCSLMTKVLISQALIEIKKGTENANKILARTLDENFGKED